MEDVLTKTERYLVNNFLFFCFLGLRIPNKLYPGSNPSGERKLTTSNPDDPHLRIIEYNKKIERDSK